MTEKAAFFDFDGTCIRGDSVVHIVRYACKNGVSPLRVFPAVGWGLLYKLGLASECAAKTHGLRFLQRMNPEQRDEFCRNFVRDDLKKRVFKDAEDCIRDLKEQGFEIWLVSASTENYMHYVKELMGAGTLLCTPIDENGTVKNNCKGEEKVRRIKAEIARRGIAVNFDACAAFGDSKSDSPMLNLTGRKCAVNAKKALIKKLPACEKLSWK